MVRACVIGDSHIPRRAREIPSLIQEKILELTNDEKFDYTLFTGDQINAPEFMDLLNNQTKKNVFIVIGNMDYFDGNRDAPIFQSLEIKFTDGDTLKIGLTHGAQISPRGDHDQLELLAKEKNSHILISGHTHHEDIFLTQKGTLLLNPGSVTGAWSFVASGIPAFIVMSINEENKNINITLYLLDKKNRDIQERKFYFIYKNNQISKKY